jgi:hypothetical protein
MIHLLKYNSRTWMMDHDPMVVIIIIPSLPAAAADSVSFWLHFLRRRAIFVHSEVEKEVRQSFSHCFSYLTRAFCRQKSSAAASV